MDIAKKIAEGIKTTALGWVVRVLAIIGAGGLIYTFTLPWWQCIFTKNLKWIYIYGWGLRHNLELLQMYIAPDITPPYMTTLAWIYMAVICLVLIAGSFIKKWWGTIMVGAVGIIHFIYTYAAVHVVIQGRLGFYNTPLEGHVQFEQGLAVTAANTAISKGYYYSLIVAAVIIVIALIKLFLVDRIQDRNK